ncbi:MAG: protein required for attachment to host cells [Candidatus Azotimanducaceae bacterium]|jgi:protein required for attachment to host cells
MAHLTTHEELRNRILTLAVIEESPTPFVSCYLNLENGEQSALQSMELRAELLRRILKGRDLEDFSESVGAIKSYVKRELLPEAKGMAFFARSSFEKEFYMPLQFAVPLPNKLRLYPTPNIYNLIELKDTYERYLVMIATTEWVRIIEVNLGAATVQAWSEHPGRRDNVGEGWSETQYQLFRKHRESRFLQEKIATLEKLMKSGDHSHLIIAGDPQITARIREALTPHLNSKLMDIIPVSHTDAETDIVKATLSIFVEQEEHDSQSIADRLIQAVRTQGPAVVGAKDCLHNLQLGKVDTLVMLQDYAPDPGWICSTCDEMGETTPKSNICPHCNSRTVRPTDLREELVRQAGKKDCPVEVVEYSDALMELGGVGCLLRFRADL